MLPNIALLVFEVLACALSPTHCGEHLEYFPPTCVTNWTAREQCLMNITGIDWRTLELCTIQR